MKYYSKSTGGFYDSLINSKIPEDAVEISEKEYTELLAEHSKGKNITSDKTGRPISDKPSGPSDEFLWAQYQQTALDALKNSDISVIRAFEEGRSVSADLVKYRQELRNIISAKSGDYSKSLPIKPGA